MAYFSYNPLDDYLVLDIECPECGHSQCHELSVPSPDFSADTHSESCNCDDEELVCESCGNILNVTVCTGIYGGDGEIYGLDFEYLKGVMEHCPEDDIIDIPDDFYEEYIDPHVKEIKETASKIDTLDPAAQALIYRNLYANVISCLEAYLSDTAISKIMADEVIKHKYVKTSLYFKEQKFALADIYDKIDTMDNAIVKRLRDIIYHNLPVVRALYKCTFNVELGDISEVMKAIQIRHDIVHRNGHDKDGNPVTVTKVDLDNLIKLISDFIQNIERQFLAIDTYTSPVSFDF